MTPTTWWRLTRAVHSTAPTWAGHSKWQNIRHDKAKNDAKKSREAYAIASRIETSVKQGGVEGNAQLATLMEKAKKLNVTKKIVENAVKRGNGETIGDEKPMSAVTYEFMGPGGVAMVVEATTDNKTRTVGLVRHALSKFNASLSPCLYMFERKGRVVFAPRDGDETLDDLLEVAIDVGAEDVEEFVDHDQEYNGERLFQVITDPSQVGDISNQLSQKGYQLKDTNVEYVSGEENEVEFPADEKAFNKALEMLDEIPEITEYYTNIRDSPDA
ncbi:hypothetical protein CANTEDRAFT_111879 [Yamadazyma tenuis ATCC 10573]|uniref:DUF28-domain-containing protein n=2 Tax=Candida tenuis TaxID=2315449 RepID=G3BC62_CANTC|nr:uncharacterized protein CANTEDRAFT_111879 [Yamadazyma tenuis ATCC 10573]EGV60129.1 hypothetical protein CANTEDRAFT_111879 [Yamadazyma tenuis ATCC 10573]